MFQLPDDKTGYISELLSVDLKLLEECNLMDYSLLLLIIDKSLLKLEQNEEIERILLDPNLNKRIIRSSNDKYIYCLGIIDYLQEYDFKKHCEHKIKYMLYGNQASAVDSKLYAFRMQNFVNKYLLGIN